MEKGKKLLTLVFLILVFFSFGFCSADIFGTVYEMHQTIEEDVLVFLENVTVLFYSVDNETYSVLTNINGSFSLSPLKEITKVAVLKEDEVILSGDLYYSPNQTQSLELFFQIPPRIHKRSIRTFGSSCPDGEVYQGYYWGLIWKDQSLDVTKRPVLLIHGWSDGKEEGKSSDWGDIEDYLIDNDFQVWRLEYWPANLENRKNAGVVKQAIERVLSKGYNYNKIDVIAHSNGGLITRAYIESFGESSCGFPRGYDNNIRKLITVSSPLSGSYFANIINDQGSIKLDFVVKSINFYSSEATKDFEIASNFTWELNQINPSSSVDYLNIAGKGILINEMESNDGIVSVINSNMIKYNIPLIILNNFHGSYQILNPINQEEKVGRVSKLFFDDNLNYQNVKDIISSGEIAYFPYGSSDSLPADLSSKGGPIIFIEGAGQINPNSVSLVKQNLVYNLNKNSRSGKWFYLDDSQIGSFDFTTMLPIGTYQIRINDQLYPFGDLIINAGQVTQKHITLDVDGDNHDINQISGGTDCDDANPNINPGAIERCNNVDDNCDGQIDEVYFDKGFSCSVGIGECRSEGIKVCRADEWGTECNAIAKEPTREICDGKDNDCDGEIDEGNVCEPLEISINSPDNNSWHRNNSVDFGFYMNWQDMALFNMYLDSNLVFQCSECSKDNLTEIGILENLSEGQHILEVELDAYYGEDEIHSAYASSNFFIDTLSPVINLTFSNIVNNTLRAPDNLDISVQINESNPDYSILVIGDKINFTNGSFEEIYSVQHIENLSKNFSWDLLTYNLSDGISNKKVYVFHGWLSDLEDKIVIGGEVCYLNESNQEECFGEVLAIFNQSNLNFISFLGFNPEEYSNPKFICTDSTLKEKVSFYINEDFKLIGEKIVPNSFFEIAVLSSDKAYNEVSESVRINYIKTNLNNPQIEIVNDSKITLLEDSEEVVSFDWNYTENNKILEDYFIYKQQPNSTSSYLVIGGLNLSSQNQTKTVYLDRIANGTGLCIKDDEISSISEISGDCKGTNEFWIACPGTNGSYNCGLVENNTRYKVTGLTHSGIKEIYCGDGFCNGDETCSSCSTDCGTCPSNNDGGGGGGGGGSSSGGGGGSTQKVNTTNNQTTDLDSTGEDEPIDETLTDDFEDSEEPKGSLITGAFIGAGKTVTIYAIIILLVLVVAFFGVRFMRNYSEMKIAWKLRKMGFVNR